MNHLARTIRGNLAYWLPLWLSPVLLACPDIAKKYCGDTGIAMIVTACFALAGMPYVRRRVTLVDWVCGCVVGFMISGVACVGVAALLGNLAP